MDPSPAQETQSKDGEAQQGGQLTDEDVGELSLTLSGKKTDLNMWASNLEVYYSRKDIVITLEESRFQFDLQATMGQSRAFSVSTFNERMTSFRQELPIALIHLTVWPIDVKGL